MNTSSSSRCPSASHNTGCRRRRPRRIQPDVAVLRMKLQFSSAGNSCHPDLKSRLTEPLCLAQTLYRFGDYGSLNSLSFAAPQLLKRRVARLAGIKQAAIVTAISTTGTNPKISG